MTDRGRDGRQPRPTPSLDGRGAPPGVVGFETPLPDCTDCSFSTVEPDADWLAVSHDGGPARAFDRRMPAFGDALSLDELHRALDHMRPSAPTRRGRGAS